MPKLNNSYQTQNEIRTAKGGAVPNAAYDF